MPANPAVDFLAPLFVPGNRPDRFAKAAASGADGVILDLEDAVAAGDKDSARNTIATSPLPANAMVRINAHGTHWFDQDVHAVSKLKIGSVMVPKAESAERIRTMRNALGALPVIALIESAEGVANVREIARAADRLAFGYIDFSADVGCSMDKHALLFARSEIVLASRLAKLHPPLEGVTPSFDDPQLVEDDSRYSASLGFGGKLCIHPKQIAPVLAGFRPPQKDIDWAAKIANSGDGAVSVDGMMVDAPVRLRAARILAAAKACDAASRTA
ncbi:MAG: CoA ester lyase [Rhizobiales bacterium]|nr:CoA ester lyase [Hyphomicrobiales bacterium]